MILLFKDNNDVLSLPYNNAYGILGATKIQHYFETEALLTIFLGPK